MSPHSADEHQSEVGPAERRILGTASGARERRSHRIRSTIELTLDRIFEPRAWAARLAYALRLQGAGGVRSSSYLIPLTRRKAGVPPVRIAFASDFHAGPTTDARVIEQACERLAEAKPDVLLLGGDFVTVRAASIEPLASLLAAIEAPLGKFAVFGNHDLRANGRQLHDAIERAGIQLLANRNVRLAAPHDDIAICGAG